MWSGEDMGSGQRTGTDTESSVSSAHPVYHYVTVGILYNRSLTFAMPTTNQPMIRKHSINSHTPLFIWGELVSCP